MLAQAIGQGSIPAALLKDGTVCRTNGDPPQCEPLGKIPSNLLKVMKSRESSFVGLFDLDRSGKLQVFLAYSIESERDCPHTSWDSVNRLCYALFVIVLRDSQHGYQPVAAVSAPSFGYSMDAWFQDENPRKLVVETRCGGSSGGCLYGLQLDKESLAPITDLPKASYYIEGSDLLPGGVAFEDINADGAAEIFIEARGRDRTAAQGAALFRWNADHYQLWWPKWKSPQYVVYAQLVRVPGDRHKEIVALSDPGGESHRRELAVWRLEGNEWKAVAKKEVPEIVGDTGLLISFPTLERIRVNRHGIEIPLKNEDGLVSVYDYASGQISAPRRSTSSR